MVHDKRVTATWWMGNNYRNKTSYYGAYPPMYLKRIESMFPYDMYNVLHLFSGTVSNSTTYTTFDCNADLKPNIVGNAEEVHKHFKRSEFDVIFADPPYRSGDAEKYGVKLPNKKKVVESCHEILIKGGILIWLDESLPMYRKEMWDVVGFITVVRSTNHRFRVATLYQKLLCQKK
jgi:16S rRNA G966 N2-methylase RsmD